MQRVLSLVLAAAALAQAAVQAQQYPARPVRLVVGYAPSGATDVQARILGERLGQALGQQFVVENRPGASGMVGAQQVARAAPDGYTLLVGGAPEVAHNVALFKSMAYDPKADLAPITLLSIAPVVLVSSAKSPLKSFQDVLKAARGGSSLFYGSVGIGTPNHIAGELLNSVADIKLSHVPYPGAGPAMQAIVGDHVPLAFLSLASAVPQIKTGALQPLAITTDRRFPTQNDIPTIAEQGFAGFNVSTWYGVLAPAKTPPEIVNRLRDEIVKILGDPEIRNRILGMGADPVGNRPAEFGAFINAEIERIRSVAAQAGIQPQ